MKQPSQWLINRYICPHCNHEWEDEWDGGVDDDCPECGTRHISPQASEDITGSDNWQFNKDWQASCRY